MASEPRYNEFAEAKFRAVVQRFVPFMYRARLIVVPLLAAFLGLLWAYGEAWWRILFLGALILTIAVVFLTEWAVSRREPPTATRLSRNFQLIAFVQLSVIYLTGGGASPLAIIGLPVLYVVALFFDRREDRLPVQLIYGFGWLFLLLNDQFRWIPVTQLAVFPASRDVASDPVFYWTRAVAITGIAIVPSQLMRIASRLSFELLGDLRQTRSDLVAQQLERLRELETYASRIAHELKNPLSSIKGLNQLLARRVAAENETDRERFQVVADEIDRIEGIVSAFATFSRPLHNLKLDEVWLGALLRECLLLYEVTLADRRIEALPLRADADLVVRADPRKLKQVLINLLQNAIDAMEHGGTLSVVARAIDGEAVEIVVSDSGVGIAPEAMERLFEPYFSTKGSGTGLGLTIARGIIRQHGGELTLESKAGEGTVARLRLPIDPPAERLDAGQTAA